MEKRKFYDGSFKLKVILEYMEGKKSLAEVAGKHQVHPNQIKNWKSRFLKQAGVVLDDRRFGRQKDSSFRRG